MHKKYLNHTSNQFKWPKYQKYFKVLLEKKVFLVLFKILWYSFTSLQTNFHFGRFLQKTALNIETSLARTVECHSLMFETGDFFIWRPAVSVKLNDSIKKCDRLCNLMRFIDCNLVWSPLNLIGLRRKNASNSFNLLSIKNRWMI